MLRALCQAVVIGLVLPVLWLVEPFRRIRLTHLWCARLGPLAFNTHGWVGRRRLDGPEPRTTRIFFGARPANAQLFAMWKRVLPIVESRLASAFYHYCGEMLSGTRFFRPLPQAFHDYQALCVQPVLSFTEQEEKRGRRLLTGMGMPEQAWFICFQARDPAFHQQRGQGDSGSHRNCRIDNYLPAAHEISRRGGWALRMGAVVERPLPETGDSRVVDYATRHRSDFGDIYLLGKCRFLLCCGTGTESVPPLFGIPVAKANMMPLRPTPVGAGGLYIPKLIRPLAGGEPISFGVCAEMGAYIYDDREREKVWEYPGRLEALGFTSEENGADDILDLCLDMLDQLDGVAPDPQAARLQALYQTRFFGHFPDAHLLPKIGSRFALKYRHLVEA